MFTLMTVYSVVLLDCLLECHHTSMRAERYYDSTNWLKAFWSVHFEKSSLMTSLWLIKVVSLSLSRSLDLAFGGLHGSLQRVLPQLAASGSVEYHCILLFTTSWTHVTPRVHTGVSLFTYWGGGWCSWVLLYNFGMSSNAQFVWDLVYEMLANSIM